jgi:hypothetical protein
VTPETLIPVAGIVARLSSLRDEARLPDECFASYPVPVDFWGPCIEFFFIPWTGRPPGPPVLHPPVQRMTVNASTGKSVRVTPARPKDYGLDMDPKQPLGEHRLDPPLEIPELLDLQQQLHQTLDVLMLSFPVMPPDPGEEARKAAEKFQTVFARIAHKPLLPFYRATHPQFFEWIERLAGDRAQG